MILLIFYICLTTKKSHKTPKATQLTELDSNIFCTFRTLHCISHSCNVLAFISPQSLLDCKSHFSSVIHTLYLPCTDNIELPVNLTCMPLDWKPMQSQGEQATQNSSDSLLSSLSELWVIKHVVSLLDSNIQVTDFF